MNPRQERFIVEYAIDHNGAAAAIRAGYSANRAKQTARELLRRPDVAAKVRQLEAESRERAGIDAEAFDAEIGRVYQRAMIGTPRTYRSSVVRDEHGEVIRVPDLSAAVRALELRAKLLGLLDRAEVEQKGSLVFELILDEDRHLDLVEGGAA